MDPTGAAISKTSDTLIAVVQAGAIGVAAVLAFFAIGALLLLFYISRASRQDRKESGVLLREVIGIQGQLFQAVQHIEQNGVKRDSQLDQILGLETQAQESGRALAVAINAVSQAVATSIEERTALKEFWSNTLTQLKAMQSDFVEARNDYNAGVAALAKSNADTFTRAFQISVSNHEVTQGKIVELHRRLDSLPDNLLTAIQPIYTQFSNTLKEAEERFFKAVEQVITAALVQRSPTIPEPALDSGDTAPLQAQGIAQPIR
jgi:hypothetical protein